MPYKLVTSGGTIYPVATEVLHKATFLNDADSMKWIRDTKIPGLAGKYKAVVLFGNEDYPELIHVYVSRHPLITDTPRVYLPELD